MLLVIAIMVKNESESLWSTLSPYVAAGLRHFFVLDTGSIDNTVQVANDFFHHHDLIGYVKQEPFIDFATSRNRTLDLAKAHFPEADFLLMPDAEWYLQHVDGLIAFCREHVFENIPLYNINVKMQSMEFFVARLFRASSDVRFSGVVHEVPEYPASVSVPAPVSFMVNASIQGIEKSRQRWQRDLLLLSAEQLRNPNDPRTAFYLAQTYECLGNHERAYEEYQYRATLNGWSEENFITLYRLGCLAENNEALSWSIAMDHYLKAFALRPHRIEPLVKIANHYWPDNIQTCYLFIKHAYDLPYPHQDMLFIEKEMYVYTRYEIMSRCAWYLGEFVLGEEASLRALRVYPNTEHLLNNLRLYQEKTAASTTLL